MTVQATTFPSTTPAPLPQAGRVLAVTARPGQESADLGGLLFALRRSGARLSLLCLTQDKSSPWEVQRAASVLGIRQVSVADYRDGGLHHYRIDEVAERIKRSAAEHDLLLVVAPENGDIEDSAVARAAIAAALHTGMPVLARTRPGVSGSWPFDLGPDAEVARAIQKAAAAEHTTRTEALATLLSHLDELDGREQVRWLVSPARLPQQR